MSESVLPMFSSRSFIVSGLTFRSLIHFEFFFVYGVRKCSRFILLQVVDQFSQHHLLKRLSFFHCISLPPYMQNRKRGTDVQNRLLDSVGEGEGRMFLENSIETLLSRVKQITSPDWMHETSARTWCTGRT